MNDFFVHKTHMLLLVVALLVVAFFVAWQPVERERASHRRREVKPKWTQQSIVVVRGRGEQLADLRSKGFYARAAQGTEAEVLAAASQAAAREGKDWALALFEDTIPDPEKFRLAVDATPTRNSVFVFGGPTCSWTRGMPGGKISAVLVGPKADVKDVRNVYAHCWLKKRS